MITSILDSPVRLRARPDLVFETTYYDGEKRVVAKNPVSLKYAMLGETEFALLQLLDGTHTVGELCEIAGQRLRPRKVTPNDVQRLLSMLQRSGLLVAEVSGQGTELLRQRRDASRNRIMKACTNVLSIRFPGVDPDGFLNRTYPYLRWLFHPISFALSLSLVLAAILFLLTNLEEFYRRLPDYQEFFAAHNLGWMMLVLGVTKVLHELGHAYTCKHFGGECHKIGFMLLVFTPALYCDASDAWLLPERWKRIAVALAGMYVEFVLAATATFVWWWTNPGVPHFLSLAVMTICSISTLVFNGNPLLRYDGYFVLSDFLRIPNLAQRSRDLFVRTLRSVCLGIRDQSAPGLPAVHRWGFLAYAISSTVYRWFILGMILWAVYRLLRPHELQSLSTGLAAISLASIAIPPLWKSGHYLLIPGQMQRINKYRLGTSIAAGIALLVSILLLPLRQNVVAPAYLEPADAERVYVAVPGRMVEISVKQGQHVEAGQILARLENQEMELQARRVDTEYASLAVHLKHLKTMAVTDMESAERIPTTEAALQDLEDQRRRIQADLGQLVLRAPSEGKVLPPLELKADGGPQNTRLSTLDPKSMGRMLDTGTSFCLISRSDAVQAVLVLDEVERNLVRPGQETRLIVHSQPWLASKGTITETASMNSETVPPDLAAQTGGGVETELTDFGARPKFTSFVARSSIDDAIPKMLVGMRGHAKVRVRSESAWIRIRRFLTKHIRFR